MSAYYFGINKGQNEYEAIQQNTSPSTDVVIKVSDISVIATKEDLFLAIEKLENFILRSNLWHT